MTEQEYADLLFVAVDESKSEGERIQAVIKLSAHVLHNLERIADGSVSQKSLLP